MLASCLKAFKMKKDRLFSNRNTLTTQKDLMFLPHVNYIVVLNVKYILRLIWGGKGFAAKYRQSSLVIVACAFLAETDRQEAVFLSKQFDPC